MSPVETAIHRGDLHLVSHVFQRGFGQIGAGCGAVPFHISKIDLALGSRPRGGGNNKTEHESKKNFLHVFLRNYILTETEYPAGILMKGRTPLRNPARTCG
jgi:hypothetical protein